MGLSLIVSAQQAPPDLAHAMAALRDYVDRLETSVPNFVCHERIVSSLYLKDKLRRQTKAESTLTTTHIKKEDRNDFAEARAEMTINGKRTKRNQIDGPFVWSGGPAYGDLHILFNSNRGELCMDRRLTGQVKLDDKDALLIETHPSPAVGTDENCHLWQVSSNDKIWLDPQTLNVMRIESFNPPARRVPGANLTLTVDYQPVTFDGVEYWLPSHFISRLDFLYEQKYLQYEAWFTDYHKYGAESVIHIDPVP